jgi:hypothetical protein
MCNSDAGNFLDVREYGESTKLSSKSNSRSEKRAARCTASMTSKEEPMMGFWRAFVMTLLVFGFAASANAGVRLYSGEMIVHTRGSDAAGNFIGVPFGRNCNTRPYHSAHTAMLTNMATTLTVTIPEFGGQVLAIDTNSDSIPDVASGCAPASLQAGLPLTGGGNLSTTGSTSTTRTASNPRGFTIPQSGISRVTLGASFPESTWLPLTNAYPWFHFEIEDADLRNDSGGFSSGGGIGSFTVSHGARVHVEAGKNQFGGTMRLLGQYHTNRGIESITTSVGATPWNLQYIGAGAATGMGGKVTGRKYSTMISRAYQNYGPLGFSARTATISVFPWTTGMVEVTATGGPQATMLERAGYDNRTPGGAGNIQLVSPALTRWQNAHSDYYTGSIATLKLSFIPEPNGLLMLVAGIGVLAILYRVNGQRGRA